MAEEAKPATKPAATKAAEKKTQEPETIKVRAADGTQLYDMVSRKLYTDNKDGVEVRANDRFVVVNLERGKLKKVG